MALQDISRRAGPYSWASNRTYTFGFKVFSTSQVAVTVLRDGTETVLNSSLYTVTLNANQDNSPGGTVVLASGVATADKVSITSAVPYTQEMVLTNQGGFYPDILNTNNDRIVAQIQQLKEEINRAIKVGVTSTMTADAYKADIEDTVTSAQTAAEAAQDAAEAAQDAAEDAAGDASDAKTAAQSALSDVTTAIAGIPTAVSTAVTNADLPGQVATAVTAADIPGLVEDEVDEQLGNTAVRVTPQTFTESQKQQARRNLDVAPDLTAVRFESQTLTTTQKTQARTNIGAFNVGDGITATGSTTARTLADRFADVVNVKDFGAKGDGVTDDTNAISSAFSTASSTGRAVYFPDATYKVTQLSIPDNTRLLGDVHFLDAGVLNDSTYVLNFGENCYADSIHLTLTYNNKYRFGIRLSKGCNVLYVLVDATTRVNNEALHMSGDNIYVGFLETHLVNRGGNVGAYVDVQLYGSNGALLDGTTHYKNITLGGFLIDGVIQGLRVGRASYCHIGDGRINGLPDDVSRTPANGHNGFLISGSDNIFFGDVTLDRILEHGIRVGGDDVGVSGNYQISHDLDFCKVVSSKHGGSALKINPSASQKCYNISIDQLVSLDSGLRPRSINRREGALRISHCSNLDCGEVISRITDTSTIGSTIHEIDTGDDRSYYPDTDIVELNNCENITISSISADSFDRSVISFNAGNDVTENDTGLAIDNVAILSVYAVDNTQSNFRLAYMANSTMPVSNVIFDNVYIKGSGFIDYFYPVNPTNCTNIYLNSNSFKSERSMGGWYEKETRGFGDGCSVIGTQKNKADISSAIMSSSVVVPSNYAGTITAGFGNLFTFTRAYGDRPAGSISAYQYDSSAGHAGLAFHTSIGQTASDALTPRWLISYNGNLHPYLDETYDIGSSSSKVNDIYAKNATIQTSDIRLKDNISDISDDVLDAWGDVNLKVFQFKDAIEQKGENARIHAGVIAQQVQQVFESKGLDAFRYGLLCYDAWNAYEETRVVIDKEAVLDEAGNVLEEEQAHEEKIQHPAGNRYSIRYEEALVLEAAYQRRRADRIEAALESVADRMATLERKVELIAGR